MKKSSLIITGIGTLLFAAGLVVSTVGREARVANAGEQKSIIVKDNFNGSNYAGAYDPNKWIQTGTNIKQSATSETYIANDGTLSMCGEAMFFGTKTVVQGLEYLQFDLRLHSTEWLSIKFYNELHDDVVYDHVYNGPNWIDHQSFHVMDTGTQDGKGSGYSSSGMAWAIGHTSSKDEWVTYRFESIDSTHIKCMAFPQGGSPDANAYFITKIDNNSIYNFANCQIAWQTCNGCKVDIDNIIIKAGTLEVNENFSDYDPDDVDGENFFANYGHGKDYVLTGNSYLEVANGAALGDKLLAKKTVKEDNSVSENVLVINAEFSIKFDSAASNDEKFAFVFGLDATSAEPNQGGGYLAFSKSEAVLKVFENGVQVSEDEDNTTALPIAVTGENGLNIKIKITKSGLAGLYKATDTGDALIKSFNYAKVEKYAGYAGFASLSNISHPICIDDLSIFNSSYYVPITKSVTHNFSNDYFGNTGHEDFYLPNEVKQNVFVKDGRLVYQGASDNAFFGSAHQYDAFILDYKICNVLTGPETSSMEYTARGKWFGLDISRKLKTYTTYGNYTMLNFCIAPSEESSSEYLQHFSQPDAELTYDDVQVVQHTAIPCQLFKNIMYDGMTRTKDMIKEEDFVCVRWISDGTNISLYLKRNGEIEFTKYATAKNLEINGYFALCCTGFTYLELDDFSMTNTSPIYVCADNEVPETVTETETTIIYDPGNVDVNLDDELYLNLADTTFGFVISTIVLGVICLGLGATLVVVLVKKKKVQKQLGGYYEE